MSLYEEIREVHGRVYAAQLHYRDAEFVSGVLDRVDKLLGKLTEDTPHKVKIEQGTWTMEHPLHERLQSSLMNCPCAQLFVSQNRGLEDGEYVLDKYGKVVV